MTEQSSLPESAWLSSARRALPWLVRLVGIGLLVFLFSRVNLSELLVIWGEADRGLILLGVLFAIGMMLVKALRWHCLLRAQGISFPLGQTAAAYFSTYYVGIVTPGRAGEFLKVFYLRSRTNASFGSAMVSVLFDRFLDIVVLVALAASGTLLVPELSFLSTTWMLAAGILTALVGGAFLLKQNFFQRFVGGLVATAARTAGLSATQAQLDDFFRGAGEVLRLRPLVTAMLLSLASWFFLLYACYLFAQSLGIPASFWYLAFAMAAAGLISLLPVSIAGIGVRDTTLAALFAVIGISLQASLAYSLLYFAVFGVVLGLVGVFFWYRCPIHS
jgi:glycosyltransferase 2 family protein